MEFAILFFFQSREDGTLGGFLRLRSTRKLSSSSIQKKIRWIKLSIIHSEKLHKKNVAPGLIYLVVRIFFSHFSEKWNWSPDSRETSLRYDHKLRQIPFFEVGGGFTQKKSWPKMCQRLGGTKKELVPPNLVNFRRPNGSQWKLFELLILKDTDMLKHVCPSQFSGIPLKEKTANSERSICHPSPKKKRRSYPQDGPRVYHSRPNIGGWFIIRLLKVKNVGPTINIRCIGWNKLPACRSNSPRNYVFFLNRYLCVQISKLQHLHRCIYTNKYTKFHQRIQMPQTVLYYKGCKHIYKRKKTPPHPKPSVWSNVYIARRLRRKPF